MSLQQISCSLIVSDFDDKICLVSLSCQESVCVLEVDTLLAEDCKDIAERTRLIFHLNCEDLCDLAYIALVLQDRDRIIDIVYDHSGDTEIHGIGNAESSHINIILLKNLAELCECSRFILKEYGNLFCCHNIPLYILK